MNIYDFKVLDIYGEEISMSKYQNRVLLIVNVASRCGFTKQYKELQKLYERYRHRDFMILGFPCNQFMNQEPSSNDNIKDFCTVNYCITFDMFSKIDVNGYNTIPLYNYLKKESKGVFGTQNIKWNFTKFLISKNGKVINRYAPIINPKDIQNDIIKLL
jgi:glutathione peroxidase